MSGISLSQLCSWLHYRRSIYTIVIPSILSFAVYTVIFLNSSYIFYKIGGDGNSSLRATTAFNDIQREKQAIAIFGGAGNVGSELTLHLRSRGYSVTAYDQDPKVDIINAIKMHSKDATPGELMKFGTVIFLGGCTGRKACSALQPKETYKQNVQDVLDLAKILSSQQHLIVASTSAVCEGIFHAKETDTIHIDPSAMDEYSYSMYEREKALETFTNSYLDSSPRISMFRFGTVVGVSVGQRTDLLVPSLFKSAYSKGVLTVDGYGTMRSFLWLKDLQLAMETVISRPQNEWTNLKKFNIWHLSSFSETIFKVASTVASLTGARIDSTDKRGSDGFSLNSTLFQSQFNFTFLGNLSICLDEIDVHVPDSITAKGAHKEITHAHENTDTIPCPVCKSTDQQIALDLGNQPFANDFQADKAKALSSPRYPLRLVRCRVCNHFHLSHVASREDLFVHYSYQSGTSKTLSLYFEWLANKVKKEAGNLPKGSVLEIACNDGSQLDQFAKIGWDTYGVDPAANIASLAQNKGHNVKIGFWGQSLRFHDLPKADALNAIVAQNVFAHVPDPVTFLKDCAAIMGKTTRLYIQTSQCDMHQLGQFDTAYHEHISFFTGHSFLKAASLAGLYIVSFETTPIHGTSCLVTMMLEDKKHKREMSLSLKERLDSEIKDGITTDFFYTKYAIRAVETRKWLLEQIHSYNHDGYTVGAYGAAAKGMTLLHFLSIGSVNPSDVDILNIIEFVVDDAPLKQNTFCPGTSIPVWPTAQIKTLNETKPVAIIIFAWNFWEEIAERLMKEMNGKWNNVILILPFPSPQVLYLNISTSGTWKYDTLHSMTYEPTLIPNPIRLPKRRKTMLITHINNEELMLPFFIIHHAPMFDHVVIIDYLSTDSSRDIIDKYAPPTWKVVESSDGSVFSADGCDKQVRHWETQYPDDWHLALTAMEFLVFPNMRNVLASLQPNSTSDGLIMQIYMKCMIGRDSLPLRNFSSLPEQRHVTLTVYTDDDSTRFNRYMHIGTLHTHEYSVGRHTYQGDPSVPTLGMYQGAFIMKYVWTPWPEIMERKRNVGKHIPKIDEERKWGSHHTAVKNATDEEMNRTHEVFLKTNEIYSYDICDVNKRIQLLNHKQALVFERAIGKVCRV